MGLLQKRKRLKELNTEYKTPHMELSFPQVSDASKEQFKEYLAKSQRNNRRKKVLVIALTVVVSAIVFYLIYSADYSRIIDVIK